MAVLGSDSKPLMIKGNRKGKTLGATGSWYKPENQEKGSVNDGYNLSRVNKRAST